MAAAGQGIGGDVVPGSFAFLCLCGPRLAGFAFLRANANFSFFFLFFESGKKSKYAKSIERS